MWVSCTTHRSARPIHLGRQIRPRQIRVSRQRLPRLPIHQKMHLCHRRQIRMQRRHHRQQRQRLRLDPRRLRRRQRPAQIHHRYLSPTAGRVLTLRHRQKIHIVDPRSHLHRVCRIRRPIRLHQTLQDHPRLRIPIRRQRNIPLHRRQRIIQIVRHIQRHRLRRARRRLRNLRRSPHRLLLQTVLRSIPQTDQKRRHRHAHQQHQEEQNFLRLRDHYCLQSLRHCSSAAATASTTAF
jgi:hypothetical protein